MQILKLHTKNGRKKMKNEGLDSYTNEQMQKISDELNLILSKYDTRLSAIIFVCRAGMLYGAMIDAKVISQNEARAIWKQAGEPIETPPKQNTRVMSMLDGEILDPEKFN